MKLKLSFTLLVAGFLSARLPAQPDAVGLAALCHYESGADITPLRNYEAAVARSAADPALRKQIEADFVRVLSVESTFEARRFVCQQLAIMGGEGCVPALASLLKNPDTVGIACLALAKNPSAKASDALLGALDSLKGLALVEVVDTLGTRREARAAQPLIRLTGAGDKEAAGSAVVALAYIGTPPALKAIEDLQQRQDSGLTTAVNEASLLVAADLVAKGDRAKAVKLYEDLLRPGHPGQVRRGAFEALVRLDPDGGLKRVTGVLAGQEEALKPAAIAAIATMPGRQVSRTFAAELPRLPASEQALLVQSLAARDDAVARAAVEAQLGSPSKDVRLVAIVAVGRVGDAAAVPLLARACAAAQGMDELKAIEMALAGLRGGEAVDRALIEQLRDGMAVRKLPVLGALVRRANPASLRVFVVEAGSSDPAIARLAFHGLSRVAKPAEVPVLLKALAALQADSAREEAEASVAQALNRTGDRARNSPAVREAMAGAKSVAARCSMLRLLAACPDSAALAAVTSALGDPDPAVKQAAMRTLADWPDLAAWTALVGVYRNAGSETERVVALRGLARLLGEQNPQPDATLIGRYRNLLTGAKDDNDRKLLLGALAGCADPEALSLAVEQLTNADVRAEAELAVRKIAEAIKEKHPQAAQAALEKLK